MVVPPSVSFQVWAEINTWTLFTTLFVSFRTRWVFLPIGLASGTQCVLDEASNVSWTTNCTPVYSPLISQFAHYHQITEKSQLSVVICLLQADASLLSQQLVSGGNQTRHGFCWQAVLCLPNAVVRQQILVVAAGCVGSNLTYIRALKDRQSWPTVSTWPSFETR